MVNHRKCLGNSPEIAAMRLDAEFLAAAKPRLYASVLSDVLDAMGLPAHALAPALRPLDPDSVLFGRARTGRYVDVEAPPAAGANPYEIEMALVDDLKAGDVAVFDCGGTERYAAWGELLTTAAQARGAVGAVIDGQTRDAKLVRASGFPLFCRSIGMLDAAGRAEMDVAVRCGGASIRPGDLVFGDIDGCLVIPAEAAEEAVRRALEKAAKEDTGRDELRAGARLRAVFARHGVL
jgi:4-hydroxy-4-methyl-2-oxoglutarate aldolase